MTEIFQRPLSDYEGDTTLENRDKYQQDSQAVPKVPISSLKIDSDFNYVVDSLNILDSEVKSVIEEGVAEGSIKTNHLVDGAVTEPKIAEQAVSNRVLKDGSVTNSKIMDGSITSAKIADQSITQEKLAANSVGTDAIIDYSITKEKIVSDAFSDTIPVGTIAKFCTDTLPDGWIFCDGSEISKNDYPQLVIFLTNSDVVLTADLPDLNTDEVAASNNGIIVKSAIKAFSDTFEMAEIEIAGLSQDVAECKAVLPEKAALFAEPIAEGHIEPDLSMPYSRELKMVTRLSTGVYRIFLSDKIESEIGTRRLRAFIQMISWGLGYEYSDPTAGTGLFYDVKIGDIASLRNDLPFKITLYYEEAGE